MTKTRTFIISLAVFILVVILGILSAVIYESYAYKGQIAGLYSKAQAASVRAASQTTLKKTLDGSKDELDQLEGHFISENNVSGFIDMLEHVSKSYNISATIGSINLGDAGDGGLKPLTLRIGGEGTWSDIIRLISAIDALPYALRIDVASVQKIDASGAPAGSWRFSADIRQYVLSQ